MTNPLVSIITSTYNDERFISEAIESVLNQTYNNFEFIIINDCSRDKTLNIMKSYASKDNRIHIINNQKNLGAAGGRNEGLKKSQGKYIAILDADDIRCDKDKLKNQVEFMENNLEYGLCGTNNYYINENSEIIGEEIRYLEDSIIRKSLIRVNQFCHSSVIIRSSFFKRGYNMKYLASQDYEMILYIGTKSKLRNLPNLSVKYRINQNGISSKKKRRQGTLALKAAFLYRKSYPNPYLGLIVQFLYFITPRKIQKFIFKIKQTFIKQ